jgi:hypothetical protein
MLWALVVRRVDQRRRRGRRGDPPLRAVHGTLLGTSFRVTGTVADEPLAVAIVGYAKTWKLGAMELRDVTLTARDRGAQIDACVAADFNGGRVHAAACHARLCQTPLRPDPVTPLKLTPSSCSVVGLVRTEKPGPFLLS